MCAADSFDANTAAIIIYNAHYTPNFKTEASKSYPEQHAIH